MKPEELAELWMELCPSLPPRRPYSLIMDKGKAPARYKHALRQLKIHPEKSFWVFIFKAVEESDYLSGRNGVWSSCGFDWVLKPSSLTKIYEGTYANKRGQIGMSKKEEDEYFRKKELERMGRSGSEITKLGDLFKGKE